MRLQTTASNFCPGFCWNSNASEAWIEIYQLIDGRLHVPAINQVPLGRRVQLAS